MLSFFARRIASAIPLLLILSVVTFAIIQAPPGDFGDYIQSQAINRGGVSQQEAQAMAQAYRVANGLDKPMPVQYFNWITGIVTRGDFGHSFYYNKPVGEVIAERLPRTLLLALVCHILASLKPGDHADHAATPRQRCGSEKLKHVTFNQHHGSNPHPLPLPSRGGSRTPQNPPPPCGEG